MEVSGLTPFLESSAYFTKKGFKLVFVCMLKCVTVRILHNMPRKVQASELCLLWHITEIHHNDLICESVC
jgi:hypothetical protein